MHLYQALKQVKVNTFHSQKEVKTLRSLKRRKTMWPYLKVSWTTLYLIICTDLTVLLTFNNSILHESMFNSLVADLTTTINLSPQFGVTKNRAVVTACDSKICEPEFHVNL